MRQHHYGKTAEGDELLDGIRKQLDILDEVLWDDDSSSTGNDEEENNTAMTDSTDTVEVTRARLEFLKMKDIALPAPVVARLIPPTTAKSQKVCFSLAINTFF